MFRCIFTSSIVLMMLLARCRLSNSLPHILPVGRRHRPLYYRLYNANGLSPWGERGLLRYGRMLRREADHYMPRKRPFSDGWGKSHDLFHYCEEYACMLDLILCGLARRQPVGNFIKQVDVGNAGRYDIEGRHLYGSAAYAPHIDMPLSRTVTSR